ncbi:putative integral membrane protein conserved region-domain-containing protein [Chlamydoabsidia padenii]|nr:putative integral membrane protein conserved region-domain-containing protein [Chlamydoabsidia padenii]
MDWIVGLFFYFLGAFTFLPLVIWITQLYITLTRSTPSAIIERNVHNVDDTSCHKYDTKQGWIYLSPTYQSKLPLVGAKGQSFGRYGHGYGVLKHGLLKIYSDEMQRLCEWTLDLNKYNVSLYPSGRQEHILFSRSVALRLTRKPTAATDTTTTAIQDDKLFFSCTRPIDKEDWYFAFLSVTDFSSSTPAICRHTIPFDPIAVASLITSVSKESDTAIPWFNAILGRTFLGIQKTHRLQHYVFETLSKKANKMTTTPGFLGNINVRSVDMGHAIPYFTNPTLVALDPDGTLVLDTLVDYTGGFKVVIETTMGNGALRLPLVLSLTLQSLSGTIRFKIKPPPSNRYWVGFCTMPRMKWSIVPAVSNYNVKLTLVTKIIESKIRRMMADNMVLPNMEDIPFARSDGLGGIFFGTENDKKMTNLINSSNRIGSTRFQSSGNDHSDNDNNPVNHHTSPATTLTFGLSSGRWSKLFTTRRRKNTTSNSSILNGEGTPVGEGLYNKVKDKYKQTENDQKANRKNIISSNTKDINGDLPIDKSSVDSTKTEMTSNLPTSTPSSSSTSSISSSSSTNTVSDNTHYSLVTDPEFGKTTMTSLDAITNDNIQTISSNHSHSSLDNTLPLRLEDEKGKPPLPPRPNTHRQIH